MDSSTRAQDMLSRFSVRSSAAALRNATATERTRVIVVALASNLVVAWLVLGVASIADGVSLLQSLRSARREADGPHQSLWRRVLHSSDPTLRAIIVEDAAALVGLGLAAIGLAGSALLNDSRWDAVASILIGLLLATTAFGLAWPLSDYLVGPSVTVEELAQLYGLLAAAPAVQEVLMLQAVYNRRQNSRFARSPRTWRLECASAWSRSARERLRG